MAREDEPTVLRIDKRTGERREIRVRDIPEDVRDDVAKAFARMAARSAMEVRDEPDALWRAFEDLERTSSAFTAAMAFGIIVAEGSEDDAVHTIESLTAMSQSARAAIRKRLGELESYRIDDEEGGE